MAPGKYGEQEPILESPLRRALGFQALTSFVLLASLCSSTKSTSCTRWRTSQPSAPVNSECPGEAVRAPGRRRAPHVCLGRAWAGACAVSAMCFVSLWALPPSLVLFSLWPTLPSLTRLISRPKLFPLCCSREPPGAPPALPPTYLLTKVQIAHRRFQGSLQGAPRCLSSLVCHLSPQASA